MRDVGVLMVTLFLGCAAAPGPAPAPLEPPAPLASAAPSASPVASVSVAPSASVSAAPSASVMAAPAPSASAAPVAATPSVDPACRGAAFDMAKLPKVCAVATKDFSATPGAFAAHLTLSADKVKAGKSVGVLAELTNTSNAPATLVFKPECSEIEPQVFRDGKRADLVDACDTLSGCMGKTMQIVLEPGGKLTARATMKLVVTKDKRPECTSYVAGPLAPGDYELRVHAPLFPTKVLDEATVKLTVVK